MNDDYRCNCCGQIAVAEEFYIFPCTHVFHRHCLISLHKEQLRTSKMILLDKARKVAENKYLRDFERKKRARIKEEQAKFEQIGGDIQILQKRLEAIANEEPDLAAAKLNIVMIPVDHRGHIVNINRKWIKIAIPSYNIQN